MLMGRNTTTVVSVDAATDEVTIRAPSMAASRKVKLRSRLWKQLSRTTIELSTIIPTPMTRPPNETILKENPKAFIRISVVNTETGIELPTIREAFQSPKKINSTIIQRMIAEISVLITLLTELRILSLVSLITDNSTPILRALICSIVLTTASVTSMVPAL